MDDVLKFQFLFKQAKAKTLMAQTLIWNDVSKRMYIKVIQYCSNSQRADMEDSFLSVVLFVFIDKTNDVYAIMLL